MAVSPYATWDLTGALAALARGNVHERKACLEGYITWAASRFDTHLKFGRALEAGFTTDTMTKADAVEARANMSGALAGLPFVASTCIDLAGSVTSASNAVLATVNRTKEDAPVMAALKSQGAWCVARANTDELSMGCTGASPADGVVKNVRCIAARLHQLRALFHPHEFPYAFVHPILVTF
ncbi:hypothetical protein EON67_05970 [archaeon]|nr:MAG: hypothetical protein EON67_05970 [archaeon]